MAKPVETEPKRKAFDLDDFRKLLQLMEKYGVSEVSMANNDESWKVRRGPRQVAYAPSMPEFAPIAAPAAPVAAQAAPAAATPAAPAPAAAPTTKDCPYCLSKVPVKATRCPNCTSQLQAT